MNTKTEFNIASNSSDAIEAWLSNLSHNPFVMNWVIYASIEAFWQSLKFEPNSPEWKECIGLAGIRSKKYGDKAEKKETFSYNWVEFIVGSKRHQFLMKVALREQLKQNPEKLKLLLGTKKANLIHAPKKKDGTLYPDSTTIPGEVFSRFLMELRSEFQDTKWSENTKKKVDEILFCKKSLYDDEDYSFLWAYKAMIWEHPNISNIMWEWYNGIVLKIKNEKDTVLKVRKPWMEKDDIFTEIVYHKKAFQLLNELKKTHPKFANIFIPEIKSYDEGKVLQTHFIMEKVDGHSLTSLAFIHFHPWLKSLSKEYVMSLTDREIIELLIKQFGETSKTIQDFKKTYGRKLILRIRRVYPELKEVLRYLAKNAVEHTDLHTGNVMIDKNGKLFIIDFGRVNF